MKRVNRPSFESLEGRQLFSGESSSSTLVASASQLVFSDVMGGSATASRTITLSNTGVTPVTIPVDGISISGSAASQFQITSGSSSEIVLEPGASHAVAVRFGATAIGPQGALLEIVTSESTGTATSVALRGLGTKGEQGDLEPSLQWILDTYQIKTRTGDLDPAEATLDFKPGPNDEVFAPFFKKAGPGPVSIVPIAVYSNAASPALTLGYYFRSSPSALLTRTMIYTVPSPDVQTLNPRVTGSSEFDPGPATFGLYSTWAAQGNRTVYTEDSRNTFIQPASKQRMFKTYPLINADGTVEPNAYIVGNEEAFNADYQDAVFIIRNVVPATAMPTANASVGVQRLVLVNTATGQDIRTIAPGETIDLAGLAVSSLGVRAEINGVASRVNFSNGTSIVGDSAAPFTSAGLKLGSNTIAVAPFSSTASGGVAGSVMTFNFTLTDSTAPVPVMPVTLRPVQDAYVRDGSFSRKSTGNGAELQLKNSYVFGSAREIYFRFDLSAVENIANAKLRINGLIHQNQTAVVGVAAGMDSDWNEATVDWDSRPMAGNALAKVTVSGSTPTWYEFDVTSYLVKSKAAGQTHVTLAVVAITQTDPYLIFSSDEAATNRPELVIIPSATPPPAPQQELVISRGGSITVDEGRETGASIRLAVKPTSNVVVTVSRTNGDTDLELNGATQFTFTPDNWNIEQNVPIYAVPDADMIHGSATFTVSSDGLASKTFTVTERDKDFTGPMLLRPIADAYVRDGSYANTTYGNDKQLQVKNVGEGWNRESFIQFDLRSTNVISSAKLRLFGKLDNTSSPSVTFSVYDASSANWTPTSTNWNNRPAAGSFITNATVVGTTGTWYELDLTSYVQQQMSIGANVITLVLKTTSTSNSTILLDSSEGTNRPELNIN